MSSLQTLEIIAGFDPAGQPIIERIPAKVLEPVDGTNPALKTEGPRGQFQLVKSPAFIKGIASGDQINYIAEDKAFELVKRSGNLAIRVFCKGDTAALCDSLAPELEKLGGELDTETERMLIFSAHVSLGFTAIEKILNDHVGDDTDSIWLYGNVYGEDGETPLNWWKQILTES